MRGGIRAPELKKRPPSARETKTLREAPCYDESRKQLYLQPLRLAAHCGSSFPHIRRERLIFE